MYFGKINISCNCKEKDVEIVELETKSCKLIILGSHIVATGDFN
jgi:hypothetical protein